jgi:hypothetical protein
VARQHGIAFDPAEIGFEFSSEEIAARIEKRHIEACIRGGQYYEYKAKGWLKRRTEPRA